MGLPAHTPIQAPVLSIVVLAGDCTDELFDLLDHLMVQDIPVHRREVVVVHRGFDRSVLRVARSFGARVLRRTAGSDAAAFNAAVREARGQFVGFLDPKTLPPRDWCSRAVTLLESRPRLAACGAQLTVPRRSSILERALARGCRSAQPATGYLPIRGLVVRRDVLERIGGFEEREIPDLDICDRICLAGYDLFHDPALSSLTLNSPRSLGQLFRQQRRHARGSRVLYRGLGVAWVPLLARLWWPTTAVLAAAALALGRPSLAALAGITLLIPPLALAVRRGALRSKSLKEFGLLLLVASTYLSGRAVGQWRPLR